MTRGIISIWAYWKSVALNVEMSKKKRDFCAITDITRKLLNLKERQKTFVIKFSIR